MPDLLNWTLVIPLYLPALAVGYLLGSVPFGLVLTRIAGQDDVRQIGSGNIGATNVLRTGRKGLAVAALLSDMLKGTAAALIGAQWGLEASLVSGFGAFFGHLFPVWLNFRGGKGVATYIGVLGGLFWPAAMIFCCVWLTMSLIFRYSSLAALTASAITPFGLAAFGQWPLMGLCSIMTGFIYLRHAANIKRLMRGEESKIGET